MKLYIHIYYLCSDLIDSMGSDLIDSMGSNRMNKLILHLHPPNSQNLNEAITVDPSIARSQLPRTVDRLFRHSPTALLPPEPITAPNALLPPESSPAPAGLPLPSRCGIQASSRRPPAALPTLEPSELPPASRCPSRAQSLAQSISSSISSPPGLVDLVLQTPSSSLHALSSYRFCSRELHALSSYRFRSMQHTLYRI